MDTAHLLYSPTYGRLVSVDPAIFDGGSQRYVSGTWEPRLGPRTYATLPASEVLVRTYTVWTDVPDLVGDPSRDDAGFYYASGRMDAGQEPVCTLAQLSRYPDESATMWVFGRLWAAHCYEFDTGLRSHAYGIERAWDNFVAQGGASVEPVR